LIDNGFAEEDIPPSAWSSPCLLVGKSDGSWRFCTDYRKVNEVTKPNSYPIPRLDECIERIGEALYITKIDLLKGYYQIPLTARAREISTFVTPDGSYRYLVMPFGMRNAPGTFQCMINQIVRNLVDTDAYIDDIDVTTIVGWSQHLTQLEEFEALGKANLTINLAKCEFGQATVTYLGHGVGNGTIWMLRAKVEAVQNYPAPKTRKQLQRFLGMVGFYMRFCKNFAHVAAALTDLLSPKRSYKWTGVSEASFQSVKRLMMEAPVLITPRYDQEFQLAIDASERGVGGVVFQKDKNGVDHPVGYFSKKFKTYQRNYSTVEKETLALILGLEHFEVYLRYPRYPVQVYTDHNPLVFLSRMKNKNRRLMRWSLIAQEYNLIIHHIKGRDNVIPDALSRIF
jgi:hypothetical protein